MSNFLIWNEKINKKVVVYSEFQSRFEAFKKHQWHDPKTRLPHRLTNSSGNMDNPMHEDCEKTLN
jgi:hypothetical protein